MNIDKAIQAAAPKYRHVLTNSDLKWATEKLHALAIINQSKKLQECTEDSIQNALLQAGSMGLSMNPVLKHCYLIPRKERSKEQGESWADYNKNVKTLAYCTPSYMGMINLATTQGVALDMAAEIVFKSDLFEYYGPTVEPKYMLNIKGNHSEASATYVYAVARMNHGIIRASYMPREDVLKIRNMSDNPNGLMWEPSKLWTEGWKKSILKRMFKTLPGISQSLQNAIDVSNTYEGTVLNEDSENRFNYITEEQSTELHSMLIEHLPETEVERWLNKLGKRFGVDNYIDIPADEFNTAKETLQAAIDAR